MKLFKILVYERFKKPVVTHFQAIESVPPISTVVSTALWKYADTIYIIDMEYEPEIINPKDQYIIYKDLLTKLMKYENYL